MCAKNAGKIDPADAEIASPRKSWLQTQAVLGKDDLATPANVTMGIVKKRLSMRRLRSRAQGKRVRESTVSVSLGTATVKFGGRGVAVGCRIVVSVTDGRVSARLRRLCRLRGMGRPGLQDAACKGVAGEWGWAWSGTVRWRAGQQGGDRAKARAGEQKK